MCVCDLTRCGKYTISKRKKLQCWDVGMFLIFLFCCSGCCFYAGLPNLNATHFGMRSDSSGLFRDLFGICSGFVRDLFGGGASGNDSKTVKLILARSHQT